MSAPTTAPPSRGSGWSELATTPLGPSRGWRPALRMAWRDLRRHQGRTAAAVVMVFLPVLAATGTTVVAATADVSTQESAMTDAGAALVVGWGSWTVEDPQSAEPPTEADVEARLGTDVLQVERGSTRVGNGEAAVGAQTVVTDPTHPMADGLLVVLDGRLPADGSEAVLSPGLADDLEVGVGGTVLVDEVARTVVGLGVERWQNPSAPALLATEDGRPARVDGVTELSWLAGEEVFDTGIGGLEELDVDLWYVGAPEEAPLLAGGAVLVTAVAVALAALEIALLAGPAFAVGVRQQQRTLALLAATGGDARALRRVVLAQALLVGAVAAGAAAVLGVVVPAVLLEAVRYRVPATIGPLDVPWPTVLGFVAVGVVAALASALLPALTAVRATVVSGLSPRPARARLPWRRPLGGLVVLVVGTAALWLAIAAGRSPGRLGVDVDAAPVGALAILALGVGMVLVVPLPVALAGRVTRGLPLGVRLAGRETSRAGARSVAAVAAVAGATAALVAAACLTTAISEEERRLYVPTTAPGVSTVYTGDVLGARETVRSALPGWRTAVTGAGGQPLPDGGTLRVDYWLPTPGCDAVTDAETGDCIVAWTPDDGSRYWQTSAVLDREAAVLQGYALDEEQLSVLDAGGVLLAESAPVPVDDGTVELREWLMPFELGAGPDPVGRPGGTAEVPVARFRPVPVSPRGTGGGQAVLVVSPAAAERLSGWYPMELLVAPDGLGQMGDGEVRATGDRLEDLLGRETVDAAGQRQPTVVMTEVGFRDPYRWADLLLLAVAAVVVLGATFSATALALADARRDRGVLTALGAAPRTQRSTAGSTAALLALTGAVLGALVGLVPGLMVGAAVLEPSVVSYGLGLSDGTSRASVGTAELVPWWALAAAVVGLPLLAGGVVALVARGRPGAEVRAGGRDG